jgi:hypothetical protein
MKKRYLSYIWKQTLRAEKNSQNHNLPNKQILLLHANLLNSHFLGDVIEMYKTNGYKFISLQEALGSRTTTDTSSKIMPFAAAYSKMLNNLFQH